MKRATAKEPADAAAAQRDRSVRAERIRRRDVGVGARGDATRIDRSNAARRVQGVAVERGELHRHAFAAALKSQLEGANVLRAEKRVPDGDVQCIQRVWRGIEKVR